MSEISKDLSLDEIKKHPILGRVLDRMEERLVAGDGTTAHTAHNAHYSSLAKDEPNE